MGWAERGLHDFPGGSLPWLAARLAAAAAEPPATRPTRLFLAQHQPVKCPWYVPDALFCFGVLDKVLLRGTLTSAGWGEADWWGAFAGHTHLYVNGTTPFDDWPAFRVFETSAAKGDGIDSAVASAVTTVDFVGGDVAAVTEHFYNLTSGSWVVVEGK
jgi:hypothetical protein